MNVNEIISELKKDSKSARWIAHDAIRELGDFKVQKKLK